MLGQWINWSYGFGTCAVWCLDFRIVSKVETVKCEFSQRDQRGLWSKAIDLRLNLDAPSVLHSLYRTWHMVRRRVGRWQPIGGTDGRVAPVPRRAGLASRATRLTAHPYSRHFTSFTLHDTDTRPRVTALATILTVRRRRRCARADDDRRCSISHSSWCHVASTPPLLMSCVRQCSRFNCAPLVVDRAFIESLCM